MLTEVRSLADSCKQPWHCVDASILGDSNHLRYAKIFQDAGVLWLTRRLLVLPAVLSSASSAGKLNCFRTGYSQCAFVSAHQDLAHGGVLAWSQGQDLLLQISTADQGVCCRLSEQ